VIRRVDGDPAALLVDASSAVLARYGPSVYAIAMENNDSTRTYPGCGGRRSYNCGCGSGCGGFLLVLVLGGALSLFNIAFSAGVSVQVPFTASNFTATGSIGAKDKAVEALPDYAQGNLASNENFINNSTTLTIGPAEGVGLLVIGQQPGAPAIDVYLALR
jgi:hypothetical protein